EGRRLAGYDRHKTKAWIITIGVWLVGIVLNIILVIVLTTTGIVSFTGGATTGQDDTTTSDTADDGSQDGGAQGGDTGDGAQDDQQAAGGAAADWADSTYGTFDPVTTTGSGEQIVELPEGVESAYVTVEDTSGDGLRSYGVDESGEMVGRQIAALPGGGTGSGVIGVETGDEATHIEVSGTGDWE